MNHQKMWDDYSQSYISYQKNPSVFFLTLTNMLRVNEATSILDAGCGGGYLHQYVLQHKNPQCTFEAFDFSLEMVKLTAVRMLRYITNPLQSLNDQISAEEANNVDLNHKLFQENKYKVFQADIQKLDQIQNNTYDIYISNLVIHLIEEKEEAVKEAFRVLKPGGKIGLTIPPLSGNILAELFSECLTKTNIVKQFPYKFSALETKNGMIECLQKIGFTDIICWNQVIPFDMYDVDETYFFPFVKVALEKATQEQRDQFYESFKNLINNKLQQNQPLTVEGLQVIARKPL